MKTAAYVLGAVLVLLTVMYFGPSEAPVVNQLADASGQEELESRIAELEDENASLSEDLDNTKSDLQQAASCIDRMNGILDAIEEASGGVSYDELDYLDSVAREELSLRPDGCSF